MRERLTKSQVRLKVRDQLIYHLEEALDGSELLMKEIWEDSRIDEEAVKDEIRAIITWLKE